MESEPPRPFTLDRTGVAWIAALALVVGPGLIVATVVVLTHGFDLGATTRGEAIAAVVVSPIALVMARAGLSELLGGVGVVVDAIGVHRRGQTLRWVDVERVDAPTWGVVELVASDRTLRLCTYLFEDPTRLTQFVAACVAHRVAPPIE